MASIADQAKILCNKEEELVDLLSEKDPAEIARNLYRKCIISDTMWTEYDCLDHEGLEGQLQVRFLLRLVSKNLENDAAVWGKFLNLLSAMGNTFNTVSKNLQDLLNKYTSSDRKSYTAVDGEKSEVILTCADAEELSKRLAEIAYKWEELAIALKLPDGERGKIRNENKSSEICLNRVFVSWLSGNHVHTSTTLGTLVEALSSPGMSKSNLGKEIEETYRPVKRAKLSKDLTGQYPNLTIINQSFNTTVADGKSTLLFVQASTRKNISYEWQKDGLSIAAISTYSGVDNDILVVSNARQGMEGKYSCQISSEGKKVCSNKIVLTVQYSPAKKQLLDLYSDASEVPQDSWPPSGTRTFINLALIESSKEPTATTDYSVKGNPDRIVEKMWRKQIEYEHVFYECTSGRLVLIEGCPGCGKTTLVHKLIIDWSKGEVLVNARLAVLITLRELNGRKAETLCDIISCVCQNGEDIVQAISSDSGEGVCLVMDGLDEFQPQQKSSSCIYQLLNKTVLPKAMVIFTTRPEAVNDLKWDKLSIKMQVFGFKKQQIYEYINSFPFMTSVCNSDHSEEVEKISSASSQRTEPDSDSNSEVETGTNLSSGSVVYGDSDNSLEYYDNVYEAESLSNDFDYIYEVESLSYFDESKASAYIRNTHNFFHYGSTATVSSAKLQKYLESNLHILHMCYLPVNLSMICFLFDSKHGQLPVTRTKLYEEFTCCIILRHLKHSDSGAQLESLQDLPKNTKKYFQDICLLAYKMTISSKEIAIPKEIGMDLSKGNLHDDMKYLGLVTTSHVATSKGFQSTCSFLHFTLQEFLAAYYISTLSIADQRREIKEHRSSAMSTVWTFYCGLVNFSDGIERLKDLLDSGSYDVKDFMHFALESQQSVVCDEVVKHAHSKFTAETPSDLSALDYILSTSSLTVSELKLYLDVEGACYVALEWLYLHRQSLSQLKVLATPLLEDSFHLMFLGYLLKSFQKLETICTGFLGVEKTLQELQMIYCVDAFISFRHLKELDFYYIFFTSHGITQIFSALQWLLSVKLHLFFCYDDGSGVIEIGMRLLLLSKNQLCTLDISDSKIDVTTASALASGLCSTSNLSELHLSGNNIGDDEASILSVGLQALSSLSVLDLSCNQIGVYGARSLFRAITLKNLTKLDLSDNHIESEGATAVAAGFQHCELLEVLNLSGNYIGSDCTIALAAGIFHCKNLNMLDLSFNELSSDGVKAIAPKIRHCENLEVLNLSYNDIGSEGARALAVEFQHFKSLKCLLLSCNSFGSIGVKAIAAKIHLCKNLKYFDLSENNIGPDDAKALACNIRYCNNLELLDFSDNNIDSNSARELASNLKQCRNLKELDLSKNTIDSGDAKAIAVMILQHCENLEVLNL